MNLRGIFLFEKILINSERQRRQILLFVMNATTSSVMLALRILILYVYIRVSSKDDLLSTNKQLITFSKILSIVSFI